LFHSPSTYSLIISCGSIVSFKIVFFLYVVIIEEEEEERRERERGEGEASYFD